LFDRKISSIVIALTTSFHEQGYLGEQHSNKNYDRTTYFVIRQLNRDYLSLLSKGLRELSRVLFAAGAREIYPSISNFCSLKSVEDLENIPNPLNASQTNLMTIHLFSSCPMGENRTKCAVDSYGKMHGFQNLYLTDASNLCDAPGVNPQGTILAIVRRNTLKFIEENKV